MIAGTSGTIIGGMHNMGKETPVQNTRMTTNYYVVYHLNYFDDNRQKHSLRLDDLKVDSWKKLLSDKWVG